MKNVETLLRTHKKFKRRYTRSAFARRWGRSTHTHTPILLLFQRLLLVLLCVPRLINKLRKMCALHHVKCYKNSQKNTKKKINVKKIVFIFIAQCSINVSYGYKDTAAAAAAAFDAACRLPHSQQLKRSAKGVKIYVIRYKCI